MNRAPRDLNGMETEDRVCRSERGLEPGPREQVSALGGPSVKVGWGRAAFTHPLPLERTLHGCLTRAASLSTAGGCYLQSKTQRVLFGALSSNPGSPPRPGEQSHLPRTLCRGGA